MKSRAHFGELVAKELGYGEAITSATVARWESGESVPDVFVLHAIAKLASLDPGWVAFGSASAAPAPADAMDAEVSAISRQRWERFVSPEWNRRFLLNLNSKAAAERINDDDERERAVKALDEDFKTLMDELSARLGR